MKRLKTNCGYIILVDNDVYDWASKRKWSLDSDGYAQGKIPGIKKVVKLHQQILGKNEGGHIDHIDGDILDNRRSNLRFVTYAQNQMNRKSAKGSSSIFKGVTWCKREKKWVVGIRINGARKALGNYKNEVQAAMAYNLAAYKYFGQYAKLNQFMPEHFYVG